MAEDVIRLTGIRATGYHGVLEHERRDGQEFVADVVMHLDTRPAAAEDRLELTVDYSAVASQVHAVLAGDPVDLVETLAERIAATVLAHEQVVAVDVVVHKPQAPVAVALTDITVEISRSREMPPVSQAPVAAARAVPTWAPVVEAGSAVPVALPVPVEPVAGEPAWAEPAEVVEEPWAEPVAGEPGWAEPDAPAESIGDDDAVTVLPGGGVPLGTATPGVVVPGLEPLPVPETSPAPEAWTPEPVADEPADEPAEQPLPHAIFPYEHEPQTWQPAAEPMPVDGAMPPPPPPGWGAAEPAVAPDTWQDAPTQALPLDALSAHAEDLAAPLTAPAEAVHGEPETPVTAWDEATAPAAPWDESPASVAPWEEAPSPVAPWDEPAAAAPPPPAPTWSPVLGAPAAGAAFPEPVGEPIPAPLSAPAPLPVPEPPAADAATETLVSEPVVPGPVTPGPVTPEPGPAGPPDRMDEVPDEPADVVLALGSNQGPSQEILRSAVSALAAVPGLEITAVAPLARTAAVGGPAQPDFLNTVVLGRTTLSPRALLQACQAVEAEHGRTRTVHWGPRTLDVDLVVHGTTTGVTEDLELPHPRAHERAFVLQPWAQVDPDAVLPGLGGGPVAALAGTAPDRDGVRWLALDWWTPPEDG